MERFTSSISLILIHIQIFFTYYCLLFYLLILGRKNYLNVNDIKMLYNDLYISFFKNDNSRIEGMIRMISKFQYSIYIYLYLRTIHLKPSSLLEILSCFVIIIFTISVFIPTNINRIKLKRLTNKPQLCILLRSLFRTSFFVMTLHYVQMKGHYSPGKGKNNTLPFHLVVLIKQNLPLRNSTESIRTMLSHWFTLKMFLNKKSYP